MRAWLCVAWLVAAGAVLDWQGSAPEDFIDADTGHRVVRLTGEAGGSTLYFHDNAFSPEGDKLIVNTPDGIAMGDVASIGTAGAKLATIAPRARGGYFARRTREINLLRVERDGTVRRERLVNMARHNYVTGRGGVEPNAHITPDKKWVIFSGQFAPGRRHVYAVAIEKANK